MASFISQYFLNEQPRAGANIVTGVSVKGALVDGTFALVATDQYVSAATLGEISVTGYTAGHGNAGRKTVTNITVSLGASGATVYVDGDDIEWSSLATGATINGVLLHIPGTTGDTDARVVAFFDLTDTPTNGSGITVSWNASGIYKYYRAAGS